MDELSDDAAAMLALGDEELPSLYADDTLLQSFMGDDESDRDNSGSALRLASAPPLSADEFVELLLAIDDDDGQQQQQQQPLPQGQDLEERPQQVLGPAPQLQPVGVKAMLEKRKKKVPSKLSNKARDGRREELMFLRKTVSELETRLSLLKINTEKSLASATGAPGEQQQQQFRHYCKPPTSMQRSSQLQVTSEQNADRSDLWKEIAHHQRDERGRSERENIRLRLLLESQLKVARSLEKFLMLKAAATTMDINKSIDLQRYGQLAQSSDLSSHGRDAAIFHDLLVGVEQMLAEVDSVYEANGLARVETTQISAQTRFDTERNTMRIEVCASKVLPFSVHETGAAVWNHYVYAKRCMPSRYYFHYSRKSTDATEDTIVENFALELHSKNKRGSFRMRQVTRRVIEDDRVVIVWCSYTDPLEFSEQRLSGLRSFEKGYIVIRESSAGVTLLQPCHIMYPCSSVEDDAIIGDDATGSNTVVGAIWDFRRSYTADFVASTYQMVENVLMEQALRKSSSAHHVPSGVRSGQQ